MKFFSLILLLSLSASCSYITSSGEVNIGEDNAKQLVLNKADSTPLLKEKVHKAIVLATQQKDYRLLVTSGRSTSIPGITGNNLQVVTSLCGKKYSAGTGDVLTSEQQREAREKLVDFMGQYNQQMLIICQEKLTRK